MKNGKKLTMAQKTLLTIHGMDWRDWLRVKDQPRTLTVIHWITGRQMLIVK